MIFGVVPAGGTSTRMGRPKLSLPFRGRTVLECVLDALRLGGCDELLVVLGPQSADLEPLASKAGVHRCVLPEQTPDMRTTVEVGLRWLEQHLRPRDCDAWLLAPADHPTLDASVVQSLCKAFVARPDKSIVVPTYNGKRGHPVLLSWKHVRGVRNHPAGEGLNTYLRRQEPEVLELPVETPEVLTDLDTPEDYARLLEFCKAASGNGV
jgi:molybdenum cofactor cytidylyltransferase